MWEDKYYGVTGNNLKDEFERTSNSNDEIKNKIIASKTQGRDISSIKKIRQRLRIFA